MNRMNRMNNAWTERPPACERMTKAVRRLAALLLFTAVSTVEATPIIQSISLNQLPGNPLSFMSFNPFDPGLGSLDSVRLQLTGTLYGEIITPQNFQGQDPAPTPYPYQMFVDHRLKGLTFDFEFSTPAKFVVQGTSSGAGGVNPVALPFSYSMTFDSFSDLVGFTVASTSGVIPPATVKSSRQDFVADLVTGSAGLLLTSQLLPLGIVSFPMVQPVLGLNGAAVLTYNYTEFVDLPGDPIAVPEPGILGLMIAGLLAMSGRRR